MVAGMKVIAQAIYVDPVGSKLVANLLALVPARVKVVPRPTMTHGHARDLIPPE
jgi:hypothetical protein